ncbi:hypothetical protein F2Q70_00016918 [Brassica cretica]|uniref:Transposase MuDR plant domain-containing protein n=1 Tax=Brassica cretica TaxID=69181 RepID=A0A8S9HSV9_BRACR|nr:hypothetical protein F2Q70_00016918 [Brassica cretica]
MKSSFYPDLFTKKTSGRLTRKSSDRRLTRKSSDRRLTWEEDDGNEDAGEEDDGEEDDGNEDEGEEDDGNEDDREEDDGDEDDGDEDDGNGDANIPVVAEAVDDAEDYSEYGKVKDEDEDEEEDDDMCFEDLKGTYAVRRKFSFRIYKSTKTLLVATCRVNGCGWKIRASVKHGTNTFWVTKYVETHTCSVGQNRPVETLYSEV